MLLRRPPRPVQLGPCPGLCWERLPCAAIWQCGRAVSSSKMRHGRRRRGALSALAPTTGAGAVRARVRALPAGTAPTSGPAHLCGPLPGGHNKCPWRPPPSPLSLGAPLAVGRLPCALVQHGPYFTLQRRLYLHLGRPHRPPTGTAKALLAAPPAPLRPGPPTPRASAALPVGSLPDLTRSPLTGAPCGVWPILAEFACTATATKTLAWRRLRPFCFWLSPRFQW